MHFEPYDNQGPIPRVGDVVALAYEVAALTVGIRAQIATCRKGPPGF